ncbi:hypothetical protein VE03_00514 [Pseudogymnoascus sp. 23342-1-I1]|nr:hypothetical protein VE03_00514 [Pseudogymnoascus sp. 23342-1-I1]
MPPNYHRHPEMDPGPDEGSDREGDVEEQEVEWKITYPKKPIANSSDRIKKLWDGAQKHESNFYGKGQIKEALNLRYNVEPGTWSGMQRYAKCTLDGVDYRKNEFVYIRPPGLELDGDDDERKFWVAQILEIRATGPRHVYALVSWMYWPDQLVNAHVGAEKPMSLRRWYHGKHELVASNHLDIEEVTSMAGHAPVAQWLEEYDDKIQEGLYWRQTFHVITGSLSGIRKHCICKKYYNPDAVLVACPNKECDIWMHEECVVNGALTKAHNALPAKPEVKKKKKKAKKRLSVDKLSRDVSYKDAVYRKRLTGTVVDNGNKIRIVDLIDMKISTEILCCLQCSTPLG